jgi:polysaccharide export outer membrane protein
MSVTSFGDGPGRVSRRAVLVGAASALAGAGCSSLPRSAPLAIELDPGGTENALEGLVAQVTPELAARTNRPTPRRFPDALRAAAEIQPTLIGVDDEIDILVWEPGGAALFGAPTEDATASTGASALSGVRVAGNGSVFVPFLGPTRAAGMTPAALRDRLRDGLGSFAAGAEVDVRLRMARSRTVTIQGAVGRPGPYIIDVGFTRIVPMLALAGGSQLPPEQVEVSLRRDGVEGAEILQDIYADPALDVALRPGDVIVLNPIRERFVALGATSAQAEIGFPTRELTLLSALGAAAGLRDFDANPQGVFVLRFEDRALADALLPGPSPVPMGAADKGLRPVAYRFDLTSGEGIFAAKTFLMRDGDALISTNAPLTEVRKVLQLFTSALIPVQQTTTLAP